MELEPQIPQGRWMRRLLLVVAIAGLIAAREAAFNRNQLRYGRPAPPLTPKILSEETSG